MPFSSLFDMNIYKKYDTHIYIHHASGCNSAIFHTNAIETKCHISHFTPKRTDKEPTSHIFHSRVWNREKPHNEQVINYSSDIPFQGWPLIIQYNNGADIYNTEHVLQNMKIIDSFSGSYIRAVRHVYVYTCRYKLFVLLLSSVLCCHMHCR